MPSENRKMPAAAFNLSASGFQLSGEPVKAEATTKYPVKMMARGSDAIPHWYFGTLAHELSGLKHKPSIPIDHIHDDGSILGYLDKFDIQPDGLHVEGCLVSTQPGDKAETIARQMAAGVPYEASIDFGGYPSRVEQLKPGQIATVNGKQLAGPAYIFREAPLRGVALCPYGADQSTSSNLATLSKDAPQIEIEVLTQEPEKMSDTPASTSAADSKAGSPEPENKQPSVEALKLAMLDELSKEFGPEIAVKALKADNPKEAALKLKIEADNAEIAKLKEDNAKLSAQSQGGAPAKFSDPSGKQKLSFAEACFGKRK